MSRSYNKVILVGNVGKKPVLKHTPGGIPVISFRMATSEMWRDKNGNKHEQTYWHSVVAWRGLAEIIDKLVTKGSRVFVEGKLQTRRNTKEYQRQIVEILADNLLILDNKSSNDIDEQSDADFDDYEIDFDLFEFE